MSFQQVGTRYVHGPAATGSGGSLVTAGPRLEQTLQNLRVPDGEEIDPSLHFGRDLQGFVIEPPDKGARLALNARTKVKLAT